MRDLEQKLEAQEQRIDELETKLARSGSEDRAIEEDLELTDLTSSQETTEELVRPQLLKLYGFMDFGFQKSFYSDESQLNTVLVTRANTFMLGNLNVFFDAQPHDDWRALLEVRFTNLPHGEETQVASPAGPYERTDTETSDFTSGTARNDVVLGSTVIERAWAEWMSSDVFRVRAGYFFTPFGIWNIDHGSPTLISITLPVALQAGQYFPSRQLGVQALGSLYSDDWEYGYHLWLGNGRTFSQVDFSDDKAFGSRLFTGNTLGPVITKLGVSGYYGTFGDVEKRAILEPGGDPLVDATIETRHVVKAREWVVGGDAALDIDALRLRSELILRRVEYEQGKRSLIAPGYENPDAYYWDAYLLAAYRLPFWGLEPFGFFEFIHLPSQLGDTGLIPSGGLNVHFNPMVQLKTQVAHIRFYDYVTESERQPSRNNATPYTSRWVIAF
jgi:hypothetical protein